MNLVSSENQTRVCITLPPKVQSFGLWKQFSSSNDDNTSNNYYWLDFSLPRLQLTIGVIFVITQACHFLLKRLGLPLFTSQLLAGIFLSPAVLKKKHSQKLMTTENVQVFGSIGTIGFAFFMFLCGVKMDLSVITRVGKRAFIIGFVSMIAPPICVLIILESSSLEVGKKHKIMFMSLIYSSSVFPSIHCLLSDLKILNSELGRIGLSAAVISDLVSLFLLVFGSLMRVAITVNVKSSVRDSLYGLFFLAIAFGILRPAMQCIVRYTPEGKPVHPIFITIITLLFLSSVSITKWYPRFLFLASYILGLAVPHGPPLGSALVEKLETMVNSLFLPTFVTASGMRITTLDLRKLTDYTTLEGGIALMSCIITLVKFLAAFLPPLLSRMPTKDCLALACIMSCKGILELSIFTSLYDFKFLDGEMYSFVTLLVLCLASTMPVLVKLFYDPSRKYAVYHRRNIVDSMPNTELPIVVCIHVPDNVRAVIKLLDISCPTKDSPMTINVLHLIKLRGQSTPIFISHQKKRKSLSSCSYSENVIVSFNKFEGNNWGAVSVNTFTAVSPSNLMLHDICAFALDKLASLIILPFHRRWYVDGSIESDDEGIRILNSKVLEKAPCSVGILIDRGEIRCQIQDTSIDPSYNVAMIFLGGRDDREALAFAKRMAQDERVCLTVMHLTADEDSDDIREWDKLIDLESLRQLKTNGYIKYIRKEVIDGPETTMIVRSMVNEFNLIIVGRRDNLESPQTSGLKDWSEFTELGILGDLLASKDYLGKCSVLVVQQQRTTQLA